MSSKMEQIIEEIEDYIDGCKPSPISRNKILVNREQLEELLSELVQRPLRRSRDIRRLSAIRRLSLLMHRRRLIR